MKKLFSLTTIILLVAAILLSTGCGAKKAESYNYTTFAMGSVADVTIYADEEKAGTIYEEINEALQFTDKCLSATQSGADIYRVNDTGAAIVDQYTLDTVKQAILLCNSFGRKIDITIGAVSELWGFATDSPSLPSAAAIEKALKTVNVGVVTVDEDNIGIILEDGQKLDLGAIGKGAACDKLVEVLRGYSCPAVISFGGMITVYGTSDKKSEWNVGIRNPQGTANDYMGIYTLTPTTHSSALYVSTSGKYEKVFEEDGKTYHHILSPETGYPVETDLASVTVVAEGGISADALSTMLFINGCDDYAQQVLSSFNAGALFIYDDGTVRTLGNYSDCFELTDTDNFTMVNE